MQFKRLNKKRAAAEKAKKQRLLAQQYREQENKDCAAAQEWHSFFAIKPVKISNGEDDTYYRYAFLETVQRRAHFNKMHYVNLPDWGSFSKWEYRDPKDAMVEKLKKTEDDTVCDQPGPSLRTTTRISTRI